MNDAPDWIDLIFRQPGVPALDIPVPQRVLRPIVSLVSSAFRLTFRAGLWQGFLFGCVATLTVVVALNIRFGRRS